MSLIARVLILCTSFLSLGATYSTKNFVIQAPTEEFARQVGEAAEVYRRELSEFWLGHEMKNWYHRCPVQVDVGQMGAGGQTTFHFDRGEVSGWQMKIHGSEERILDSVLPHEINHTIFACHFRRPIPRWADEGAASIIEHRSERMRLREIHERAIRTSRSIPLKNLLAMKEYPTDTQDVLTMYAEGHALTEFLMRDGDRKKFLRLLGEAHSSGWEKAVRNCYGYERVGDLESDWNQWVMAGYPKLDQDRAATLAAAEEPQTNRAEQPLVRGQSPSSEMAATERSPERTLPDNRVASDGRLSRNALVRPLATIPIAPGDEPNRRAARP